MPITTAHTMLVSVSNSVGMKRSAISWLTGRLLRVEMPKSPCAMRHEEVDELLRHRLVETEVGAHQRDGRLVRFGTGGEPRRIARQQMHEQEHQHGDDEQRRQQATETFDEEVQHETQSGNDAGNEESCAAVSATVRSRCAAGTTTSAARRLARSARLVT